MADRVKGGEDGRGRVEHGVEEARLFSPPLAVPLLRGLGQAEVVLPQVAAANPHPPMVQQQKSVLRLAEDRWLGSRGGSVELARCSSGSIHALAGQKPKSWSKASRFPHYLVKYVHFLRH